QRREALDRLRDRGAAGPEHHDLSCRHDRHRRPLTHVQLRTGIKRRVLRWHMYVEDGVRALAQLGGALIDHLDELVLGRLTRGLPRSLVAPAETDHRMAEDVDDSILARHDVFELPFEQWLEHLLLVVIPPGYV